MLDEWQGKMLDLFNIRNNIRTIQPEVPCEAVNMEILSAIAKNLEHGDSSAVKELLREALAMNIPPDIILNSGLIKGMDAVGKKFKAEIRHRQSKHDNERIIAELVNFAPVKMETQKPQEENVRISGTEINEDIPF